MPSKPRRSRKARRSSLRNLASSHRLSSRQFLLRPTARRVLSSAAQCVPLPALFMNLSVSNADA